jgi:hypothetical protein
MKLLLPFLALVSLGVEARSLKDPQQQPLKASACGEDLSRHCSSVLADRERLTLCLKKNQSKLSPACAKETEGRFAEVTKQDPCTQDILDKCYDEHSKEVGLSMRCLFKQQGKLAPKCQTSVTAKMNQMRKMNPCFDDTEKLCPGTANRGEIYQCLSQKTAQLSKACQADMAKEAALAAKNPCHLDIKRHCRTGLKPQGLAKCLQEHSDELSPQCRESVKAKKDKLADLKEACEDDREKLCKGYKGKIIDCLKLNRSKVSMSCSLLLPK